MKSGGMRTSENMKSTVMRTTVSKKPRQKESQGYGTFLCKHIVPLVDVTPEWLYELMEGDNHGNSKELKAIFRREAVSDYLVKTIMNKKVYKESVRSQEVLLKAKEVSAIFDLRAKQRKDQVKLYATNAQVTKIADLAVVIHLCEVELADTVQEKLVAKVMNTASYKDFEALSMTKTTKGKHKRTATQHKDEQWCEGKVKKGKMHSPRHRTRGKLDEPQADAQLEKELWNVKLKLKLEPQSPKPKLKIGIPSEVAKSILEAQDPKVITMIDTVAMTDEVIMTDIPESPTPMPHLPRSLHCAEVLERTLTASAPTAHDIEKEVRQVFSAEVEMEQMAEFIELTADNQFLLESLQHVPALNI
eukprot:CAMPEP_0174718096 /NCGR_PEP_ID=MMETSP1094-20130205/28018_1 /TAXON_ID=156173 /ORGANISM="Chrysochromulina brevifilum, Strain UTEX LB 985" /LENGTH=359 /DNA_ID=CAMNT_0015918131 /DNA_START=277 /DNA_END=1356 /DNA_ORIENTATION=-